MTDEIRFVGDMQKVTLKPGDVLVVTCSHPLTDNNAEYLRKYIAESFPGHKCLVLGDGLKLGVVEKVA